MGKLISQSSRLMKTITTALESNTPWGSMNLFSSLRATLELTASKEFKQKPKSNNKVEFDNILFKHTDNFYKSTWRLYREMMTIIISFLKAAWLFLEHLQSSPWKLPPLQTNRAVGCTPCGPMSQFTSHEATSELSTFKECIQNQSKPIQK